MGFRRVDAMRPASADSLDAPVLRNSAVLVANSMGTAVLGVLFWILAARRYPDESVGAASAVISLLLFLANFAELNLTSVLSRFLPTAGPNTRRLLVRAYFLAASIGFVSGCVALMVGPRLVLIRRLIDLGAIGIVWFALAVSVWCIFALQDAAAIALRGSVWVPVENALFGVMKIVVLVLVASTTPAYGLLLSWTLPMALILVPMNLMIFFVLIPAESRRGGYVETVTTRQIGSFAAVEYLSSLAGTASATLIPLIVAAIAGAKASAYFYVVWVITASIETAINSIGTILVVEGARDPQRLAVIARTLAKSVFGIGIPCVAVGLLLAHTVLSVFGRAYAHEGSTLLRLILLGAIPRAAIVLWMAMKRVERRLTRVLLIQTFVSASMIGLTAWGVSSTGKTTSVGLAYLACQTVAAAFILRDFVRGLRGRGSVTPCAS